MRKNIRWGAVVAVVLMALFSFSAPVRAEMPVGWVSDLIAWYLEQNGVGGGEGGPNIVVLLPGTSFDSETTPGSENPVFEVITGANEHILYRESGGLRGLRVLDEVAPMGAYTGHMGTLVGAGSDINYNFSTYPWFVLSFFAPGQYLPYWNGTANTSEMFGDIKWNWVSCLGSGQNGFTITMDFYHNGMRYGVVVNNKGIGYPVCMCPYGLVFPFTGTYTGIRTSAMGPPTRDSYMGRGNNHVNGIVP